MAKNSTGTITYLTGGGGIMGFKRSSDGAMFWFITDALSTVRDVVNSSVTVVASYEFSEYGQRITSSESGVSSQKTFVGGLSVQDEVTDTGLILMGHRFYDTGLLGRFLNRDPIGYAGGMNLYSYAGANPSTSIDYTGLQPPEGVMDRRLGIEAPPSTYPGHNNPLGGAAVFAVMSLPFLAFGPEILAMALANPIETVALTEAVAATALGYPGPSASLPIPTPRVSVAAGMVEATLPCGGHATAILGSPIQVYRVFSQGGPPGTGSTLMAAVLKAAGFKPGDEFLLRAIQNSLTLDALDEEIPIAQTLIGSYSQIWCTARKSSSSFPTGLLVFNFDSIGEFDAADDVGQMMKAS